MSTRCWIDEEPSLSNADGGSRFWETGLSANSLLGTRVEEPDRTRSRLSAYLPGHGITRVGNVTGLDRLGIPVYMAMRPNSRSLSVSQGKGLSHDAAWVSAVMESLEL